MTTNLPYGDWPSPLDTADVFARPGMPQFPERYDGVLYWVQSLPEEKGRLVLVYQSEDGKVHHFTPVGFNIRTRVHEYGGRSHVLGFGHCWFINFDDQRLYRQALPSPGGKHDSTAGNAPVVVTPPVDSPDGWMLADPVLHPSGQWLIAAGERARDGMENENAIVAVDLRNPGTDQHTIIPLATGNDFYSTPRLSGDGKRLCYIRWNHPNMPWDSTELVVGSFDSATGELQDPKVVAGGNGESICQPAYRAGDALLFMRDRNGEQAADDFWNIYAHQNGVETTITAELAEYGAPHWVFGHSRLTPLDEERVLAVRTAVDGDSLVVVANNTTTDVAADTDFVQFSQLSEQRDGKVLLLAQSAIRDASIVEFDANTNRLDEVVVGSPLLDRADTSVASSLASPTRDGKTTYSWAYTPRNSQCAAPNNTLPPLMVMVHGGPTSRSGSAFDPMRQFWTTRGFAVLDINHRGSTGFGRRYRQALNGLWGERDVDDVVDAVKHITSSGGADPQRVFIRGGSAGGYVVLAAMTRFPDVFCAGACYYGIGNLVTLAQSTHKFEARYLDTLLGESWDPTLEGNQDSVYYQRSPINHMHLARSRMILFQGADDRVVPPEVSREVVRALEKNGIDHRYVEYAGEGHGFRSAPNRIDALESEAAFFQAGNL